MLAQSIDQMLAAIDRNAHHDAATWLGQFGGLLTDKAIALAAQDFADYRFERWSDELMPALRETYIFVFQIVACPPGSWLWQKRAEDTETL